MSRSQAINTRLEKLVPSMEECFTQGIMTKEAIHDVAKQRMHLEYRLAARPLLLLDVRSALDFELEMERKLSNFCSASKTNLQHRWTALDRAEYVMSIALKHLKRKAEWEEARKWFLHLLAQFQRVSSISKLYAGWVTKYPNRGDLWSEAALFELHHSDVDTARSLVQHAVTVLPASPEVWRACLTIELEFVKRIMATLVEAAVVAKDVEPEASLVAQQPHMVPVVLQLDLCRVVVEECLKCEPRITLSLYDLCLKFRFTSRLCRTILVVGFRSALAISKKDKSKTIRSKSNIDATLAEIALRFVENEWLLALRGCTDASTYLDQQVRLGQGLDLQAAVSKQRTVPWLRSRSLVPTASQLIDVLMYCIAVCVELLFHLSVDLSSSVSHPLRALFFRLIASVDSSTTSVLSAEQKSVVVFTVCGGVKRELVLSSLAAVCDVSDPKMWHLSVSSAVEELWQDEGVDTAASFIEDLVVLKKARKETASSWSLEELSKHLSPQKLSQMSMAVPVEGVTSKDEMMSKLLMIDVCPTTAEKLINVARVLKNVLAHNASHVSCWRLFVVKFVLAHSQCKLDEDDDLAILTPLTDGVAFLRSVAHASLSFDDQSERHLGAFVLVSLLLATTAGWRPPQSTSIFSTVDIAPVTIEEIVQLVLKCKNLSLLSHQADALLKKCVFSPNSRCMQGNLIVPFWTAMMVSQRATNSKQIAPLLSKCRLEHDNLIQLHREPLSSLSVFQPIIGQECHVMQSEAQLKAQAGAMEVADWVRYIKFEQTVVRDLVRCQEVSARAVKEVRNPQLLLSLLCAPQK